MNPFTKFIYDNIKRNSSGKLDVSVSKVNCNFRENPLEFSDTQSRRINSGKLVVLHLRCIHQTTVTTTVHAFGDSVKKTKMKFEFYNSMQSIQILSYYLHMNSKIFLYILTIKQRKFVCTFQSFYRRVHSCFEFLPNTASA